MSYIVEKKRNCEGNAVKQKDLSNRILEIDLLRGICVLLMIFDHLMYDFWGLLPDLFSGFPPRSGFGETVYDFSVFYWQWDVRVITRYIVIFFFLSLTGVCCSFSKSNLKRGVRLGIVSILLTAVTGVIGYVIDEKTLMILFGVLHCIALTLIVIGLLEKCFQNKWIYLVLGLAMIALGIYFEQDQVFLYYGRENIFLILLRTVIGTARSGSDHFSFFLNGGQIFVGVFLGKLLYQKKKSVFGWKYHNNPLTFVGRNSLFVYIAHQVLIPVILGVILLICGYSLAL
jgi:uncharacterized membrane protein